ncbi:MAG: flagellar basal body L-ring protein FlgH [Planctomycetaceae bacterium]
MSTRRFRLVALMLAVGLGLLAWTTLPNLAEEKPAAQAVSGNVTITVQAVGEREPGKDDQTNERRKRLERKRHEIEGQIEAITSKIAEIKSRLSSSNDEESDDEAHERKQIGKKLEELQRERARLIEQRRLVGITIGPVTTTHRAQGHAIMVVGTEGDAAEEKAKQPQILKFEWKGPPHIQKVAAELHPEIDEGQKILQKLTHRIRHLMQAAENLEQAGDPDLARGLRQKAEHLQAEAKEHQANLEARAKELRHHNVEKMAKFYPDWHIAQLKEIVGDLRNEVRELRSEIRALREALKDDDDEDEREDDDDGDESERKGDTRREEKRDRDRDVRDKDRDEANRNRGLEFISLPGPIQAVRFKGDRDEAKIDHRSRSLIIPAGAIRTTRGETKKPRQLGIEFKLTGAGPKGHIQFITVGEEESPDDDAVEAKKPVTDKLINSIDRPQLDYRIAAQVVDVMPNGNLAIESRQSYCENNEIWEYVLTGIIRADDIRRENIAFCENIANLDIVKRKR